LALSNDAGFDPTNVVPLLNKESQSVAIETARALRGYRDRDSVIQAAGAKLQSIVAESKFRPLAQQLALVLNQQAANRPADLEQWKQVLASGSDPESGRRVFQSAYATCSKCHTIDGTGGTLGPDLSNVAQSSDRRQIIQSILRPSDQFPPQYQAWVVVTTDGVIHTGLQLDHKAGGAIELFTIDGRTERFDANRIEEHQASPKSLMPDNLETNLTVSDFRELVAFLESLK